jgi:hypothetical protein
MPIDTLESVLRERRAVNAGIAKAALFAASYDGDRSAKALLAEFGLTADDLRNADEVERIEHYGATVDDVIALLTDEPSI